MINDTQINAIKSLLNAKKKIVITTHQNPDGDAMGSSLGLYNFLKLKKNNVIVVTPNSFPEFLHWMPGSDKVVDGELYFRKAEKQIKEADIIFCLDYNALHRTYMLEEVLKSSKGIKILIDHHQQPDNFAQYIYSDTKASSTCQMIYIFITMLGEKSLINKDIANCLYTGIMTDTGSFRFNSTKAETHRTVAELIDKGADNALIHQRVFDTNNIDRMRLLGYCLSEKLTVLPEIQTGFISLSAEELQRFNHQKGNTEGVVNYALSIKEVVFSAMFIEREEEIKISFRSKGTFDVNQFARNHFNGGGHKNAAGGQSDLTLDETISMFIEVLKQYKSELHNQ